MKRIFFVIIILLAFASPVMAAGKPFDFTLYWRNVVPEGSGDANVTGTAKVWVNSGQGQLCWEISAVYYAGSWPPTGAFIHRGLAGENGPAVIDLGAPMPPPDTYVASGCASASASLLKDIQQNPARYYLQIVNETHPDGATRGQLRN